MPVVIRFAVLAGALALAGCQSALTALANDPNAICGKETSVWVNVSLDRNHGCEYPPPGFYLAPIPGYAPPAATPAK